MKRIRDIISKPSEAINATIIGLLRQNQRKDFKIDMDTFGSRGAQVCYGCAATSCVQQITKQDLVAGIFPFDLEFPYDKSFQVFDGFDVEDIKSFEFAIDELRQGSIVGLLVYFNMYGYALNWSIPDDLVLEYESLNIAMETDDWCCFIPKLIQFTHRLREVGF